MSKPWQFTPAQRLRRPAEFQAVFEKTAAKVSEPWFLLLSKPNGLTHPRLGLVIAKKKVRHAVERNRIKRAVRESFRLYRAELPCVDVIFMARSDIGQVPALELRAALQQAWRRLQRKVGKSAPTGASSS